MRPRARPPLRHPPGRAREPSLASVARLARERLAPRERRIPRPHPDRGSVRTRHAGRRHPPSVARRRRATERRGVGDDGRRDAAVARGGRDNREGHHRERRREGRRGRPPAGSGEGEGHPANFLLSSRTVSVVARGARQRARAAARPTRPPPSDDAPRRHARAILPPARLRRNLGRHSDPRVSPLEERGHAFFRVDARRSPVRFGEAGPAPRASGCPPRAAPLARAVALGRVGEALPARANPPTLALAPPTPWRWRSTSDAKR